MRIVIEISEGGAAAPLRISITDEASPVPGGTPVPAAPGGTPGALDAGLAPSAALQAASTGAPVIPIPAPGGDGPPAGPSDLSAGAAPGAGSAAPAVSVENAP